MNETAPEPATGPSLSVIVPTFNRARLIPRAIRSILTDAHVPIELIVVDDGSEDDTENVVESIGDERIRYLPIAHAGVSAARNRGADAATGAWLAFFDSDDEALPGWADAMVAAAERSGGAAMCGGEAVSPSRGTTWTWLPPAPDDRPGQEFAEKFLPGMFILDRRAFARAGGYVESLAFGENTELALRVLFLDRTQVSVDRRVLVRRHVGATRTHYSTARLASARYVISTHPWLEARLPALWASYHAILGVDSARQRDWRQARRHFTAAVRARPRPSHIARWSASAFPYIGSRVWPPARPEAEVD